MAAGVSAGTMGQARRPAESKGRRRHRGSGLPESLRAGEAGQSGDAEVTDDSSCFHVPVMDSNAFGSQWLVYYQADGF